MLRPESASATSASGSGTARVDASNLPSTRSRIPIERREGGGWFRRCVRTLFAATVAPGHMFSRCPEPVDHGTALRFLATLRLLPWVALIAWLTASFALRDEPAAVASRSVHILVDPALAEALSVWLVIMTPVGMPLLYFVCGLVAHVSVGLTGGASRSVGASMRATGYAMGPALLGIAVMDVPLYTSGIPATIYLGVIGALVAVFLWISGIALARTHQIHTVRGFLVAVPPTVVLAALVLARGVLQLDAVPGVPVPSSPYWVP